MAQIITALRRQATKSLIALHKEIAKREKELETVKAEAGRWESALGKEVKVGRAPVAQRGTRRQVKSARRAKKVQRAQKAQRAKKVQRLDWNVILGQLPETFTSKDVAQKIGKRTRYVYGGVLRWMKDKKVRKTDKGYQKV